MSKSTPKVSVLIPICNVEKYLEECLSSVANQTLTEMEVICINDGSTDGSLDIIKKYVEKYSNFKLIDKKNSGYGDSMNHGLEVATGEYIGIVESDDYIVKEMFEELYALTKGGTADIVKGNFWDFYENEDGNKEFVVNMDRDMISGSKKLFTLYEKPQMLFGHPSIWSGIYKRSFLNEHNIRFMCEPGGGWVDNPFFFEAFCAANSIAWTKKPYYYYRKTNPNSSSNRQPDLTLPLRRMMDNLDVIDKYNVTDEEILKMAYSRALMYINGVLSEKDYVTQMDSVKQYARKLLLRLKPSVIVNNFNEWDQVFYYKFLSILNSKITEKQKILIYNWIQFDNERGFGGGVNIYCRNLIEIILKLCPEIDVYFLSSGFVYDATRTDCYIQATNNMFGDRCKTFEVVNSPVPAAQDNIINNPGIAIEGEALKNTVDNFIKRNGPFVAIHLNNIEGLSLDCLDLKKKYPDTRFVFSLHNYVPFCLHGFYYDRHKKCVCNPDHTAEDCINCTSVGRRTNLANGIYERAIVFVEKKYGKQIYSNKNAKKLGVIEKSQWLKAMGFNILDIVNESDNVTDFMKVAVAKLNDNMDVILCVAKRVEKIALENGFDPARTRTSYIGTKVAEFQHRKKVVKENDDILKLAFLGSNYSFTEKGYPFLMQALSELDEKDASRIDLMLTTTNGDEKKMRKILSKFHSVDIVHGYRHSDLRWLLMDCDLGVVPVLWEDNLPQISIEMAAMGVPVLASNLGGASELCASDLFTFEGGNKEDFKKHLLNFLNNRELLEEYWNNHNPLITMEDHLSEIKEIYGIKDSSHNTVTFSMGEFAMLKRENDYLRELCQYKIWASGPKRRSLASRVLRPVESFSKVIRYLRNHGVKETVAAILRNL